MKAYYNEHDPYCAQWLRNLIEAGHIAAGDVDERDIQDVRPDELAGYTQCHFFAGIGGWSHALRIAGWPDDRPVWTGSCPCQPFSAAGKGEGFADERHLWPAFFHLIAQCRPVALLGEQVASKDGLAWLDLVYADLEAAGYAIGSVDLCAAGVGAPHIRQRLWFLAHPNGRDTGTERQQRGGQYGQQPQNGITGERLAESEDRRSQTGIRNGGSKSGTRRGRTDVVGRQPPSELADSHARGFGMHGDAAGEAGKISIAHLEQYGATSKLGNTLGTRLERYIGHGDDGKEPGRFDAQSCGSVAEAGATRGFWYNAEWIYCRDGKWRPVEPGTFPLAHGVQNRVGRLRGYGNAINPWVAAEVIRAYMAL